MLLLIDNYDSFTYNIAHYLRELGSSVKVVKNDACTLDTIGEMVPKGIIVSPGPCTPNHAGLSMGVIKSFAGKVPILGVCLGHQSIGQVFGGNIVRAKRVMHGKTSEIHHDGRGLFSGIPSPFVATRYHSLVVDAKSLPPQLKVTAWTNDMYGARDEVMGIRHLSFPIEGVQFHPESILSENGHYILQRFLDMVSKPFK